ncbi:MAG: hypothetical protein JXQ29_06030 [Planctomycetes bacterium]|nr:hypothetical protein [Planctomycetota bacterium]
MSGLLRPTLVFVLLSLAGSGLSAQKEARRGTYFRNDKPPFGLWIPAGLAGGREAEKDGSGMLARFRGEEYLGGNLSIYLRPAISVEAVAAQFEQDLERRFPGQTSQVIPGEPDCAFENIVLQTSGLGAKAEFREGMVLTAVIRLDRHSAVALHWSFAGETLDAALPALRWMLRTFRAGGASSLDRFLEKRWWHAGTGFSFRPPRGFGAAPPAEAADFLYGATSMPPERTLMVRRAGSLSVHMILQDLRDCGQRDGEIWKSPNDVGATAAAAFFVDDAGARGTAAVAVGFAEEHFLLFAVAGPIGRREDFLETAELVAASAEHVDLAEAQRAVAEAIAALEHARVRRETAGQREALAVLARYPFLPEASTALARALPAIAEPELAVAVATALADAPNPAVAGDVLKALRHFESARQVSVVIALLGTLGGVRDRRAITILFRHAEKAPVDEATAAIQSLGRYRDIDGDLVARRLVQLLEKLEIAAQRSEEQQLRARGLRPAFFAALSALSGEAVSSLAQAREVLRRQ